MRSFLMTDAYNDAQNLKASLEADLEIIAAFEELMNLEEQQEEKAAEKKKTVVKNLHYRRTA
ncbi:hypothetical protein [Mucilaginibacter agri]|uniref:Uncharacterized protein n=1 Tax=Mucilaginibacter agri TaxID=2695265 RepID=A0A965ZIM8_9SPHI|nr:hypothetical protein [Mucilaginibacter agri]NCD71775.1 hypothetical protein [Mucilaginibacter agri]